LDWRRAESSSQVLRAGGSVWGPGGSASRGGSGRGGSGWGAPGGGAPTRGGGRGTAGRSGTTGGSGTPRRQGGDAPRASFGSATPRADVPSLEVGARVTHDAYGLGTVVAVEGSGPNAVAKIDFGADGTKRLLLRYSPVTKL